MNSAHIGNLPTYELGNDWCVFKERLNIWLGANLIVKDESSTGGSAVDRRRAVLLSALSENAYKLVREFIAPKTVDNLSYEEIVTEIDKHLLPKKSLFAERHFFHSATQRVGEDFTQWAARVRQLSTDCNFGSGVDDMLRDRFILGMQLGAERDRLFMENPDSLTLVKALDIAVSLNSARQAARQSSSTARAPPPLVPGDVYRVSPQSSSSSTNSVRCEGCGYNNHSVEKCRFKNYRCSKCGQRGHLKRMCKAKQQINLIETADEDYGDDGKQEAIYNIRTYRGEAMKLSVEVCGQSIDFEVDSGSCATAIPLETYKQHFFHLPLTPPRTILKSYSGEIVNVVSGVGKL